MAFIGNTRTRGINIIINVTLKTAGCYFAFYKIIVLPSHITGNNFFKYLVDYSSFGLSPSHRDYILVTEAYLKRCIINSVTLCAADIAIYNRHIKTREFILFFQADISNTMCRRNLLYSHRTPTLQRHGKVWLYHFP